jgi:diamine N-acetyltransferase
MGAHGPLEGEGVGGVDRRPEGVRRMSGPAAQGDAPRLVPVDATNRASCLALRVHRTQHTLIASNEKSLQQAAQNPQLVTRALVVADRVVGFAMFQKRADGSAYIWRVMVDAEHQGRGLGRRLLELLLEELGAAGLRPVFISHRPENRVAAKLFESMGFFEVDFEADGEVVRQLKVGGDPG